MDLVWILVAVIVLGVAGVFYYGWITGGRHRETKIRIEGLKDVTAHYLRMVEDYKKTDRLIDATRERLGLRALRRKGGDVSKAK